MKRTFEQYRVLAGYSTQTALAQEMGISNKTVNSWERGRAFPRPTELYRLSETLGISSGDVIQGIVNEQQKQKE